MSFIKYAYAPVLEVVSEVRDITKLAHNHRFAYNPKDGFLYVRLRGISSRVNDNDDGFRPQELKDHWKTFVGCPNFIEHNNANWRKARGRVVDATFHEDDAPEDLLKLQSSSYESDQKYNPIIWCPDNHLELYAKVNDKLAVNFKRDDWIELLVEVDGETYPKYAKALADGKITTFSMGCDVEYSVCSYCGNKATSPSEYCSHIANQKGQWLHKNGHNIRAYEDNCDISFFEISAVKNPADPTASLITLDKAACDCNERIVALRKLGENLLDKPVDRSLVYSFLSECYRCPINEDKVAEHLAAIEREL